MRYYFYNAISLLLLYESRYKINPGSLLDFNMNFTLSSLAHMPANSLDSSLHLLPVKFALDIPTTRTTKTFAELVDERASQLVKYARDNNKTITTFYSGGIDSTSVLVALLKQNVNDILTVACNASSIYENRTLYEQYLKDKVKIQYIQDVDYRPETNIFFVRTSGADTLMGGDLQVLFFYSYREAMADKPTRDLFAKMINFVANAMTDWQVDILYNQILSTAKTLGVELNTFWDLVTFFDLTNKVANLYWQDFGYFFKLSHPQQDFVNLDTWVSRFYITEEFYSWALYSSTVEDKIGNNLFEFKKVMKDYIYDFNRDQNFYLNKTKFSSLGIRPIPKKAKNYYAIDQDFKLVGLNDGILEQLHAANEKMIKHEI